MNEGFNSAGSLLKYAVETTAGTRPTTGYTTIPGVKAIPPLGNEVNTLQTTTLSATKNHTYTNGLADTGGAVAITVNDTTAFRTAWDACVTAYAGLTGGKQLWFEYAFPPDSGLDSFYIPGQPLPYGFGGMEVDTVLENTANFLPEGDYIYEVAST